MYASSMAITCLHVPVMPSKTSLVYLTILGRAVVDMDTRTAQPAFFAHGTRVLSMCTGTAV